MEDDDIDFFPFVPPNQVELTIQYGETDLALELCKEYGIPASAVPLDGERGREVEGSGCGGMKMLLSHRNAD